MKNKEYFRNKKIAVVGIARSGLACANLLYRLGARVSVSDSSDNQYTRLAVSRLESPQIKWELGAHSEDFIRGSDMLVVSPGIKKDALPFSWAAKFAVPIVSEIEVAWMLCPAEIIAITGSNGKTTVTSMIGEILQAQRKKAFVCGNIGNPFCAQVENMDEGDYAVLEVSSFQLETIKDFRPKIALILNFSPNHLDRYNNLDEYLAAKRRIFENQGKGDFLVLNRQDPRLTGLSACNGSQLVYFSAGRGLNENQAAVISVASLLGIEEGVCMDIFRNFQGVEHRLEFVAEINNVRFINDSKATTVESTLWALDNLQRPVVLIAGGRDKGLDYSPIIKKARDKMRRVVLIGEAKEKIKGALSPQIAVSEAGGIEDAVEIAFRQAQPGDCVLLSPMCASFDMFRDYEERGRAFKQAVFRIKPASAEAS